MGDGYVEYGNGGVADGNVVRKMEVGDAAPRGDGEVPWVRWEPADGASGREGWCLPQRVVSPQSV